MRFARNSYCRCQMLRPLKIILAILFATITSAALGASTGSAAEIFMDDYWTYRGSIEVKPPKVKSCERIPCDRWCTANACAHGDGELVTDGGEVYSGQFAHGLFHGHGVYDNDWFEYTGGFRNGKHHGHGVLKCVESSIEYEGSFVNSTMHGNFTLTAPDGSISTMHYNHKHYDRFGGPC